jgi:uncharacterized membrane protein YcjF (UPF0283 family)
MENDMSTNIHRHTARPSRSRVTRARVSAWIDRHSDALTAIAVGALVVILTTLTALALISDGISTADAIGASAVSLSCVIFATFFAHILTDDRTSRRVYRRWASNHARAREEWNTYCDQMAQRYEESLARAYGERDSLQAQLRATTESLRRMTRERDWLIESDETERLAYERDSVAHLALRLSGIDLPHGVTIHDAAMSAFHIARGNHESCDDMTERDLVEARARIVNMALDSSPFA